MRRPVRALGILMIVSAAAASTVGEPVMLGPRERAQLVALEGLRDDALQSSDLRDKAVVVTFFASWCPPCRAEFIHLNTIAGEFEGSDLAIVAINVFEEFDQNDQLRLPRFLEDLKPRFHVVKGDESIKRSFGDIQRIPTVFVFDREGRPVLRFIHARGASKMSVTEDELRAAVFRALAP